MWCDAAFCDATVGMPDIDKRMDVRTCGLLLDAITILCGLHIFNSLYVPVVCLGVSEYAFVFHEIGAAE